MIPPRLYLVDASPYVFRAFFALPDSLVDPDGRPVGAVYGFAAFLIKLLAEEEPTHLAVAFDGSLTTSFRNELYPEYKAQREAAPAELKAQIGDCRRVAEALGAASFIDDRYEADDIVGTFVERLVGDGRGGAGQDEVEAVVVTSDKDLAQLVGPRVTLLDFARHERLGPAEVEERIGVPPRLVADYLALAGDSVDNIPGVRGIGPKTAVALLTGIGDLEAVYADLAAVERLPVRGAAGVRRKLEAERETAFLSRRLATIATDAPVEAGLGELEWRGAGREAVEEELGRLGFEGLRERVPRWAP